MLKGITWGQFGVFILVATGIYYLYIGLRFYGSEIIRWAGRGNSGSTGGRRAQGKGTAGKSGDDPASASASDQAELFERGDRVAEGNELFQAMQRAIGVVRQVIAQGVEHKLDRENLLDHLREVLSNYRQLKGTDYAGTINNFLMRVCSSEFSLKLGEAELAELWK